MRYIAIQTFGGKVCNTYVYLGFVIFFFNLRFNLFITPWTWFR